MNPNSQFNPDIFLQGTYTDAGSTKTTPHPIGEYIGIITEAVARQVQGKKDPGQYYVFLDYTVEVPVPVEAQEELGRETSKLRYSGSLDLTPQNGIDWGKGKNVWLGRLREAIGQNIPGQEWHPRMPVGRPIKVIVGHRTGDNPDDLYSDIKSIAPVE
jgi:hypothetical protein